MYKIVIDSAIILIIKALQIAGYKRKERIWTLLTRGNMKGYEIAKELNVSSPTIARDIKFLTAESQNYLNDLARETLPFMYQISIEGIRDIIRECWNIYQRENDETINMYQKISALKLAKECNEAWNHQDLHVTEQHVVL